MATWNGVLSYKDIKSGNIVVFECSVYVRPWPCVLWVAELQLPARYTPPPSHFDLYSLIHSSQCYWVCLLVLYINIVE